LKQEVKAAPNAEVVTEKAPVVQQPKKESPKAKHDVQVSPVHTASDFVAACL